MIKKTKDREESIFAEIHPAEQNTGKNTGIVQPLPHPITAPVNKIIPFSCVDGFGNRTAIFFQGCNQDCLYCHNPETIHLCKNCGACVNACLAQALSLVDGKVVYDKDCCCNCDTCLSVCDHCASPKVCWISAKTLYQQVKDYFPFIDGITTSGGECSLYLDFLLEFYSMVKAANKTTYMDTNGQVPLWERPDLLSVMDKAMVDLKAGTNDDHKTLTGLSADLPIENIQRLAEMEKLYEIRTVVVPGIVDNRKTVEVGSRLIARYPGVRYKLIKFRHYGVRKNFASTPEPSDEMMNELKMIAEVSGVREVVIV